MHSSLISSDKFLCAVGVGSVESEGQWSAYSQMGHLRLLPTPAKAQETSWKRPRFKNQSLGELARTLGDTYKPLAACTRSSQSAWDCGCTSHLTVWNWEGFRRPTPHQAPPDSSQLLGEKEPVLFKGVALTTLQGTARHPGVCGQQKSELMDYERASGGGSWGWVGRWGDLRGVRMNPVKIHCV